MAPSIKTTTNQPAFNFDGLPTELKMMIFSCLDQELNAFLGVRGLSEFVMTGLWKRYCAKKFDVNTITATKENDIQWLLLRKLHKALLLNKVIIALPNRAGQVKKLAIPMPCVRPLTKRRGERRIQLPFYWNDGTVDTVLSQLKNLEALVLTAVGIPYLRSGADESCSPNRFLRIYGARPKINLPAHIKSLYIQDMVTPDGRDAHGRPLKGHPGRDYYHSSLLEHFQGFNNITRLSITAQKPDNSYPSRAFAYFTSFTSLVNFELILVDAGWPTSEVTEVLIAELRQIPTLRSLTYDYGQESSVKALRADWPRRLPQVTCFRFPAWSVIECFDMFVSEEVCRYNFHVQLLFNEWLLYHQIVDLTADWCQEGLDQGVGGDWTSVGTANKLMQCITTIQKILKERQHNGTDGRSASK